ncbi:hypothetical protein SAMN05443246_5600 [Paenibacillus sp. GP183]|nr:hypothetical protein SAMN05443246_5600 [Paenibacillus sp. GP183]
MQLKSVIKNDGSGDMLAWKFLGEVFNRKCINSYVPLSSSYLLYNFSGHRCEQ